ncbi:MAG: hypothetical protein WC644_10425 [Ignavibacteria bacterium]
MMEIKNNYFRNYTIFVLLISIITLAAVYFWQKSGGNIEFKSVLAAAVINVLNSIIGFRIILGSIESKNSKQFMVASLGSMTARLFIVLIMILIGLLLFNFNKKSFIFALFCYYFSFLTLETIFLIKRINVRKRA